MSSSRYLEELEKSGMNLIIYKEGNAIFSSSHKGIRTLLEALNMFGKDNLKGVLTVDRIVGRAAAFLNVYMGTSEAHAALISIGAKQVFNENCVRFQFLSETDAIKNPNGTEICPFEKLVQNISNPEEAYVKIVAKLADY